MLRIEDLSAGYGARTVLHSVSLSIADGEAVAVLGPNGAGKSTLVKMVAGAVRPKSGRVFFGDTDITALKPWKRTELGLAMVPEGRHIIPGLTVDENLRVGAHLVRDRKKLTSSLDMVFTMFPILAERRRQQGTTLSGGQQQMLAIGRALMSSPKLLLLDEPSLGLAPVVRTQLSTILRELRAGVSILLVEQELALAMDVTDRYHLMRDGAFVADGVSGEEGEQLLRTEYLR
ncbi:MAG TPA: ABC transporter ATP-binding protein [Amycolatopsis sp.]|nr:ABC transporter ATP-binding protein [Amycolatopsis sp.]